MTKASAITMPALPWWKPAPVPVKPWRICWRPCLLPFEKEKKLLVSTATVALQEQILDKDLPNLRTPFPCPLSLPVGERAGAVICALLKLG